MVVQNIIYNYSTYIQHAVHMYNIQYIIYNLYYSSNTLVTGE